LVTTGRRACGQVGVGEGVETDGLGDAEGPDEGPPDDGLPDGLPGVELPGLLVVGPDVGVVLDDVAEELGDVGVEELDVAVGTGTDGSGGAMVAAELDGAGSGAGRAVRIGVAVGLGLAVATVGEGLTGVDVAPSVTGGVLAL